MAYATDAKFHFKFDEEPLSDSVTANFLTVTGTTPEITEGVFADAWQMKDTVYAVSPDTFAPTTALTIGFWLKPVNPGMVTNPGTLDTVPLKMPICAKATFVVGGTITATGNTLIIWEETQDNGNNVMKVSIRGTLIGSPVVATLTSSEYEVDTFHHFWIVFDGSNASLTLYVDTIEDISATTSGSVPDTLAANSSLFSINRNVVGELWEVARNSGVIDDMIVFTSAKASGSTIVRAANSGAEYVADAAYVDIEEIDQAAVFDDPGTAQITSVHTNRGRVYVARSDGKLLRGTKLIWQSRREFGNSSEASALTTINKGDSGFVRVSFGALQIQDKIVRV